MALIFRILCALNVLALAVTVPRISIGTIRSKIATTALLIALPATMRPVCCASLNTKFWQITLAVKNVQPGPSTKRIQTHVWLAVLTV